jgi:hypothetical protein
MEPFRESKRIGLNMAVVMFMVVTQEFFGRKIKEDIKKFAEINAGDTRI